MRRDARRSAPKRAASLSAMPGSSVFEPLGQSVAQVRDAGERAPLGADPALYPTLRLAIGHPEQRRHDFDTQAIGHFERRVILHEHPVGKSRVVLREDGQRDAGAMHFRQHGRR